MPAQEALVPVKAPKGRPKKGTARPAPSRALVRGSVHDFTVVVGVEPPPQFAPVRCKAHPGSKVIRWGLGNKEGTRRQRYRCEPEGGSRAHTFTPTLPRTAVDLEPAWGEADVVRNPHRGPTASGRGQTSTTEVVAEGLQMISRGVSYAQVGRWARDKRPARTRDPVVAAASLAAVNARRIRRGETPVAAMPRTGANFWHAGADWVEMFSPPLWEAWLSKLAAQSASPLPHVVVLDDVPFYSGHAYTARGRPAMAFSVLVLRDYFSTAAHPLIYTHRTRLIRAFPNHTTDAYELLMREAGIEPEVIVSDSSTAILSLVERLREKTPQLVWAPSAYHARLQMERWMAKLHWGRPRHTFLYGDLLSRVQDLSFIASGVRWRQWWRDFDARFAAQGVPTALYPDKWRAQFEPAISKGVAYLDAHPGMPRGTGAVEAAIRSEVVPFFESRSSVFTNIERVNRAADLLTLRLNGQMNDRQRICEILRADALANAGYAPPPRSISERQGERRLRDERVLAATLAATKGAAPPAPKKKRASGGGPTSSKKKTPARRARP